MADIKGCNQSLGSFPKLLGHQCVFLNLGGPVAGICLGVYFGCGPRTVPVTARIITFLAGDPQKTFISHCYCEGAISKVYYLTVISNKHN